jgi:hypothetical protein
MPENDDANELLLRPTRPDEAREQARECLGFIRGRVFDLGDDRTWELPNPSLLDDEQQQRYSEYLHLYNHKVDQEPDVRDEHGNVLRRGGPKDPPQIDGEMIEPADIALAKALMGDEVYQTFVAAGGRSSQIRLHWTEMSRRIIERLRDDSKSKPGAVVGAAVPDGD